MENKQDIESSQGDNEHFVPEYRDRLRTWLVKMIDSDTIPGLCWENEDKTIFRMPWKHAGRQDYNLEEDSKIFMAWAKHSGRYREGIDKPEPIVWKTRLRCALNKMPDIKELPNRSRLDISEPYRVYQLLPPVHKASQIRRRFYHRSHSHDYSKETDSHSQTSAESSLRNSWTREQSDSAEAAQYQTSPTMLSGASAVNSPGFWFAPPANMSLQSPMTANLLQTSRSAAVADTIGHLQRLAQSRFPLITSLRPPFVPFPPTGIPPYFPPNLEALKQLELAKQTTSSSKLTNHITAHAEATEEKYHEPTFYKINDEKLPGSKQRSSDDRTSVDINNSRQEVLRQDVLRQDVPRQAFHSHQPILNSNPPADMKRPKIEGEVQEEIEHHVPDLSEVHHLYQELTHSLRKISSLETDLKRSRTAHAREREARKNLEIEKEEMRAKFNEMRDGLKELSSHVISDDERISRSTQNINQIGFKSHPPIRSNFSRTKSVSPLNSAPYWGGDLSPASTCRSPSSLEVMKKSPLSNSHPVLRKRSASPLDLTVQPLKKRSFSKEESNSSVDLSSKPTGSFSILLGGNRSSSPARSLSSEDKRILSPLSSASGSPDNTGRSRSLSPIVLGSNIFSHHQHHHETISVS